MGDCLADGWAQRRAASKGGYSAAKWASWKAAWLVDEKAGSSAVQKAFDLAALRDDSTAASKGEQRAAKTAYQMVAWKECGWAGDSAVWKVAH